MNPIYVVKRPNTVQFNVFNFARFMPFSFIASQDGQTDFTLPAVPVNMMLVAINGATQDGAKTPPDYTVSGQILTLSDGVDSGDAVYGVIQY